VVSYSVGKHKFQASVNKVLRKICGIKKNSVRKQFSIQHNEELGDFHRSPNIVRLMKYKWIRWAGYVCRMGKSMHIES